MARWQTRGSIATVSGNSDMGLVKSGWDECHVYFPKSVAKRLVQQIMAANQLLAQLEILGEQTIAISPKMKDDRCDFIAGLVRLSTNTKANCNVCRKREERPMKAKRSKPDPDCDAIGL